ncbi:putative rab GTPase-activating protein 1-like [Scophthalmus maximus]|uniref:Putative rab GTPase-activating protein 1-like n=1 Tax=Scophthalmus maximus TaxID=52904 RepID=A0A2U9BZX3_SCOMX|nr:putative rab GTPase-activating protein 1-like [Scophthalmus maximus]
MRKRSGSSAGRRSSTFRRRSDNLHFDEFGFAVTKRKEQKLHHRCHDYSYPQLSSLRVTELCELLSYWNGASFICKSQIERFIRMGIPPSLRGPVWRCLLSTDGLRESSDFNYQKCLLEVRGPLVDLGVSEYSILSAIATLSDTQNDLDLNHQPPSGCPEPCYSADDITVFRQIALDLQRSFPTHRSLMGDRPEAIEGQAKLFRVLIAYAKYNPQVGYSQGMSYIAAVLLMQLGEEEAFWALAALLDKPKYLTELFDLSLTKVQHQVKVFDQFLKHRKPTLSQHLAMVEALPFCRKFFCDLDSRENDTESVGVLSVHFVMPWFLTLFTSLPCWDSVLAVWDLIILHGLSAVFRIALTIIDLLEPRLMDLNDEGAVLPLLLRVPVDVAKYTVLVPALWNTEVQDWEIKCMNSLVLDDGARTEQGETQTATLSSQTSEGKEEEQNAPAPSAGGKSAEKDSVAGAKSVLTRVMRLAQRYLSNPMGRQRAEEKSSQTHSKPRQRSPAPGRVFRSRTSASQTKAQYKNVRVIMNLWWDKFDLSRPLQSSAEQTFQRAATGPVGRVARHHSNHKIRVKSLRLLRNGKNPLNQSPPSSSSSVPPSSLRSSTLPPLSSAPSSNPLSSEQTKQRDAPRMAFSKEFSSRHQTRFRESTLI